jgi:hypothetical protein
MPLIGPEGRIERTVNLPRLLHAIDIQRGRQDLHRLALQAQNFAVDHGVDQAQVRSKSTRRAAARARQGMIRYAYP